ncbi:MAG: O-antigen ligase family protein [Kouleothrix sp.]|nr:O-antigen ligase family protein [Kouleothrix sp.]
MPFADSIVAKLLLLTPPVIVSMLLTLLNARDGYALWSISLGFLVTQTGYQLDIGKIRISALEILLVVLLPILWWQSNRSIKINFRLRRSAYICLILFFAYSIIMFAISMINHIELDFIVNEFKGFLLYPLMAYVVAAGLQKYEHLRLSIITVVFMYVLVATRGILDFARHMGGGAWYDVYRTSGGYAPINTYGITMLTICMLTLGIGLSLHDRRLKLLLLMISAWLFLGAVVSVSRTVWIAGIGGIIALVISGRRGKYAIGLLLVALILFLTLPDQVAGRIDQISDSSSDKRSFYLESGIQTWKARWLTGWGWGVAYWYQPTIGLVPAEDMPWYHNDYLNLAVQVGAIGLMLYLGYWLQVLHTAHQWLRKHARSRAFGILLGGQMALVALLVSAGFEHVLWKPDIAGLVGWVCGLMLACMRLHDDEALQPRAA